MLQVVCLAQVQVQVLKHCAAEAAFCPCRTEQLCDPGRAHSACEFGVLHCCDTDMIHAGLVI